MDVTRTKTKPATRAITIEDLMEFRIPNDPQISPDGSRVICPVTAVDAASNGYRTHLWIVPVDGAPWQLTAAAARDVNPRWSPDGTRLVFVSDRGGYERLWVIAAGGGEARALTSGKLSPGEPVWFLTVGRSHSSASRSRKPGRTSLTSRVITRLRYKQDGEGSWTAGGNRCSSWPRTAAPPAR